jgi:uncharacterized protein (DUF2235 family)
MKRLVICCDGTWNSADRESNGKPCATNVLKNAVRVARRDKSDVPQIIFYHEGVGTGNILDRFGGGAFGDGLENNIHDSYRFLMANYEAGDEIFLFGFSRGAFTARSLGGMIRKCGILSRRAVGRYLEAERLYRSKSHPDDDVCVNFRRETSVVADADLSIRFIGVWDTVGALGMPVLGLRGWASHKYEFHDTELSGIVRSAYHALAIDERRGPFQPTLWDYKPKEGQTIQQTWFCGVHSDVGGGYGENGLSDIALGWMLEKAEEAGLELDREAVDNYPLDPQPSGELHDSMTILYRFLRDYVRPMGLPSQASKNAAPDGSDPTQQLHESVIERWRTDLTYRPENLRAYFQRTGNDLWKS